MSVEYLQEIALVAQRFAELFQARTEARVQAIHQTVGVIRGELQSWKGRSLSQQLKQQLADLAIGCPPVVCTRRRGREISKSH